MAQNPIEHSIHRISNLEISAEQPTMAAQNTDANSNVHLRSTSSLAAASKEKKTFPKTNNYSLRTPKNVTSKNEIRRRTSFLFELLSFRKKRTLNMLGHHKEIGMAIGGIFNGINSI